MRNRERIGGYQEQEIIGLLLHLAFPMKNLLLGVVSQEKLLTSASVGPVRETDVEMECDF